MDQEYLNSLFSVDGQVFVITGAGGVLCGTMARELARLGGRVCVLDLRLEAAEQVVSEIEHAGGEALAVHADVLNRVSLVEAAGRIIAAYGHVDVLINGAGGNQKAATTTPDLTFFDLPEDAFQWVFNLNFLGTLLPTQVFGKLMAERGQGTILNMASVNAIKPLTNIPAYSAAKGAVRNFTEWLAVHMCQNYSANIRVNALAPGFFLTNQNRFLLTDADTGEMTPRGQTIIGHTPAGRYGDPTELISTVLWLVSPGAGFVTGVTVPVDGGFCAFGGV